MEIVYKVCYAVLLLFEPTYFIESYSHSSQFSGE